MAKEKDIAVVAKLNPVITQGHKLKASPLDGLFSYNKDADTIAAITGSLAGAKFGYNAIPERWINQLNPDVKNTLEKFQHFVFDLAFLLTVFFFFFALVYTC